ncbi:CPBP family intramembrane metalloprotease [Planococcus sp. CP5-4]|uniref:CPBP family intramembrane glutamic endopeptidase n=1 Tax=unclassified Planococcus (in: firmicutes) TaxID=2662419 RepID=UPI001C24A772|nr:MULTISPECIES: type II CAAX endopeptidase family protein [unclassified Planococcus (in: firmicutes)]MBU9673828.1 CPBP family intramembrane metalloprotease [Planococcus sp. CP5-4_YE]MBV0908956.1 CPBP family intramembrane metalloprotease [Planococcus sp. CP5-4_UN]MBW6064005.1 CPBP family intramembrane metalloprotease [Planococcus sp. CP5-4]
MARKKKPRFVLGLMTVASIVSISFLLQVAGNPFLNSIFALLLFYTVLPMWICSYYFKKRGVKLRQVVFSHGIALWLLPIFALTLLIMIFSMSIYWLLLRALMSTAPALVTLFLTPEPLPDVFWYLAATGFVVAVVAPIAEEFVFRGVLLNQLMDVFGLWKGIGITSLIFAVFHLNFLGAFLFAVIASILYVKSGNLLAPVLLHSANNTLAVYQAFAGTSFMEWLTVTSVNDLYTKSAPNLIALIASTVLLLLIIGWMSRGLEQRRSPIR